MKIGNKWYKGQELWENIQTWSLMALLIVALVLTNLKVTDSEGNPTSILNPQTTGYLLQGIVYYVLLYTIGYVYSLYSHAKKRSGTSIIKGPMDQGPEMGEDCEFRVKKFKRAKKSTAIDKKELLALLEKAKLEGRLPDHTNQGKRKELLAEDNGKKINKGKETNKSKDGKDKNFN
ncbi:MAG: hypothetical protein KJI71_01665 [Patescibacteria group bacterium]|nr:hypothetical protein [Patescibacteria group bacterium]